MKKLILFAILPVIAMMVSCQGKESEQGASETKAFSIDELGVSWATLGNMYKGADMYKAEFTFTNNSKQEFPKSGWTLYFSKIPRNLIADSTSQAVNIECITGDFYKITPTEEFPSIAPGESFTFGYCSQNWLVKITDTPCGLYFVFKDDEGNDLEPQDVKNLTIAPFDTEDKFTMGQGDKIPNPTPAYLYNEYSRVGELTDEGFSPIIPQPENLTLGKGTFSISDKSTITTGATFENEAEFLAQSLKNNFGINVEKGTDSAGTIQFQLLKTEVAAPEAYTLEINENAIIISASSAAGAFYGAQSLIQLVPNENLSKSLTDIQFPLISVQDQPRFGYRGMSLDAGRNFHSKESVLKMLDLMALLKLNKFHFHFCDDEGWRIEIPGLPELTDVGAKRGHTIDELDMLYPAYGSGAAVDAEGNYGSGFYSRADMVEILTYATARHIEVIPEIDVPGHSRAAIKAMMARASNLKDDAEKASEYALHDPNDKSEYTSIQNYKDNVVCVCQESTYRFISKVVEELALMYKDAGAPFVNVHCGGDEVPHGVWEKSPKCQELMKAEGMTSVHDLKDYFLKRYVAIMEQHNIDVGGWEEIALHIEKDGEKEIKTINPEFAGKLKPYVWNSVFGWGSEDLGYKLANSGYNVVLSNVTNLYFDLAYSKDPYEPGYYWGGLVDTRKSFEFAPFDLYKIAFNSRMGDKMNYPQDFEGKVRLTTEGTNNIRGIQGQIWSETIKGQDMLEYYLCPKILGLAERAWSPQEEFETLEDNDKRIESLNAAWEQFANTTGRVVLPKLDKLFGGINYRVPPVGAVSNSGQIEANVLYPGLIIRYTSNGSEPTVDSEEYSGPIEDNGNITLRAFTASGRASRSTKVGGQVLQ